MRHSPFTLLKDDTIQYNLAAHVTLIIFFYRLCRILYTCYNVIVIAKSEKADVNAV